MNRSPKPRNAEAVPQVQHHTPPMLPEDCWDEPVALAILRTPSDLEQIQGAWVSVNGRRQVEFLISGNRFTVHFARGSIYFGTFELDPSARPKTMTVHIEEGQPQHKGLKASCIYEIDGNHLLWCTPGPGSTERLTGFPPERDSRYLCLVFRRETAVDDEAPG